MKRRRTASKRGRVRAKRKRSLRVLGPDELVRCEVLHATIAVRVCIQRQEARWPGKKAPYYDFCGSGRCADGKRYSRTVKTRGWKPAPFRTVPADIVGQWKAKRRWLRERAEFAPTVDHPPMTEAGPTLPPVGTDSAPLRLRPIPAERLDSSADPLGEMLRREGDDA